MPRPRKNSLFDLGGQWIARDPASPFLYRFWYEPGTSRCRRASLGTADLDEAKVRLAEIVVNGTPASNDTPLATVLEAYCREHGDKTSTGKQARHAARLMLKCWGPTIRTGALTEDMQRRFVDWSLEQGHKLSYVARNLVVLSAAIHRARLPIAIFASEARLRSDLGYAGDPQRRAYIPTDDELARLWRADMPENLRRWILIAMATGCRPAAALDLSPASRIPDAGLLALNPEGRAQNKKVRPTVRCPAVLTEALDAWEKAGLDAHDGRYVGYASRYSVRQALERVCETPEVNLPKLTPYSFRHKVTTVLRIAGVPEDQISRQLGHSGTGARTTARYGEWSPDYLKAASAALDTWIKSIQKNATSQEFSQDFPKHEAKKSVIQT